MLYICIVLIDTTMKWMLLLFAKKTIKSEHDIACDKLSADITRLNDRAKRLTSDINIGGPITSHYLNS